MIKERKRNRCEKASTVDNNQGDETGQDVAGVIFLTDRAEVET